MEINLDYKVNMSVNMMYRTTRFGRFLTTKALQQRARIIQDIKKYNFNTEDLEDKRLSVGLIFTEDWYYKNGEIKKTDLDNRLKFIIDSIFKTLNLNDKLIFEIYAKKQQSELKESVQISITKIQEEIWEKRL